MSILLTLICYSITFLTTSLLYYLAITPLWSICQGKTNKKRNLFKCITRDFSRFGVRKSSVTITSQEIYRRSGEGNIHTISVLNSPDESFDKVTCGTSSGVTIVVAATGESFKWDLCQYLSSYYSLKWFSDGLQAWDYILNKGADLLLCDTSLKGMSGNKISSRVKTSLKVFPIPVILLDSLAGTNSPQTRRYSSADLYLPKPLPLGKLKMEIDILLSNSFSCRRYMLNAILGETFLEKRFGNEKDATCRLIIEVKDFILEHIAEEGLNVEQIASHMNMSRSKFFALWKSLTGAAPQKFLHAVRMEKARKLLESGNYTVNMVPEMVGLKDEKYFRTIYKKYFGKTPSESIKYRKE